MIEKLLGLFGYEKARDIPELTEQELCYKLACKLGDITEYKIDPSEEAQIFKLLADVEGFGNYLRATLAKDLQRHFTASTEKQRDNIMGAVGRTVYLRSKLMQSKEEKPVDTALPNLRYNRSVL